MIRADIVGNVGSAPELVATKSGIPMARFSVASNSKTKQGEVKTSWVSVICFDAMAENAASELRSGQRVIVTGRMEIEEYEKKDGQRGKSVTLIADEIGNSLRFRDEKSDAKGDAFETSGAF